MTEEPKKEGHQKSDIALKEEKILAFWQENKIFEKSLQKESPNGEFVFYDGPPFATGLPHYGHLLGSTIKDVIPRYKTMRGYSVRRRWGWDCHGLPVENIVEKKLGLKHKKDIEALGIEKFNEECRSQVLTYVHDWKKYVDRLGRWVDFDDSYKTMDPSYTESVWWALSQMNEKGLLYEGRKVLLYCPRCETPLSRAEIAMDNSYRDITEEAVTIKFHLKSGQKFGKYETKDSAYMLAWTTTPWTLPANVALAVGSEINYTALRIKNETGLYIIATDLVEKVFKDKEVEIVHGDISGKDLVGLEYEPLYDLPAVRATGKKAWYVTSADFVNTEEGTGIVHTAVIYGEDDYQLGLKVDLPMVPLLLPNGNYNDNAPEFVRGVYIKKGNTLVKDDLESRGLLFARAMNTHSYPHCYRCDTPLIYNALSSWFINIQKIKKRMIELNENVTWIPEHLKHGRFLDIVENAPDWTISRNRFWASPLPVWKCQSCQKTKIIGSLDDLKKESASSGNTYFLMRHAESTGNVANAMSVEVGDEGDALTDNGKVQAKETAKKIADKPDYIYCSEFVRSKETAEVVALELGLSPEQIIVEERLGEFKVAEKEFNGQKAGWHNFWQKYPDMIDRYTVNMSAENYTDATSRMIAVFNDLEEKYKDKKILVISHELPLRLLLVGYDSMSTKEKIEKLKEIDARFQNAEVRKFEFVPLPRNARAEIDFHRPYIDRVEMVCRCGGKMTRIPEVIDCWVESGSMPFAEYNYPHQGKTEFEKRTPGDFVAEYIAQTRTWFYYMHAISTALFDHEAFKNVVTTGTILAADGNKMSKSKGNFTDPLIIIDRYGSDALRYYMMTSVVMQAEDLSFKDDDVKDVYQRMINILRNVVTFFETYNKSDVSEITIESQNVLDKWILSRLSDLHSEVTANLEKYDTIRAGKPIRGFIDDLSTWYLRRSRDRFKSENKTDREESSGTMAFVLSELSKIMAPFMPFLAEEIYQKVNLSKGKESVHLEKWSDVNIPIEDGLLEKMKKVREIVTIALELRQKAGVKVRQPLQELRIKNNEYGMGPEFLEIIKDEINVKSVVMDETADEEVWLDTTITQELKEEGLVRDIIRGIQDVRKKEGCSPNDKIKMSVQGNDETFSVIRKNIELVQKTTGTEMEFVTEPQKHEINLDGGKMSAGINKSGLEV